MKNKICQSCGMPITSNEQLGTNRDGSANIDYCKYCYKNGKDYQSYLRHPHKPHKPYERHVYKTQKSASLGRIQRKEYILTKTSEEMSEQVSELLKSSSSKDILAGIDLLIRMVEKEICRNGNNIVH